jgi:hypothetical protein
LATDERDKVYALVGLASDGDHMVPVPNYEQPPKDVFEQMTRLLIKRCPNILLFRHPNRETHKCLPSWLPDWAELSGIYRPWHSSLAGPDHDSISIQKIRDSVQQAVATWSWKMESSIRPPLEFNERLSLKMKGKIVDEVDDVSPLPCDKKIDPKKTEEEYIRRQKTRTYEGKSQNLNNYNLTLAEIAKCISMERMVFSMDTDNLLRAVDQLSHLSSKIDPCIKGFSMLLDKELAYCKTKTHEKLLQWLDIIGPLPIAGKPFEDWVKEARKFTASGSFEPGIEEAVSNMYIRRVALVVDCGMTLATTKKGRVAMVHPQTRRGDAIYTLLGCDMPVVLRESDRTTERSYYVVGEAYMHDVHNSMDTSWESIGKKLDPIEGMSDVRIL